MEGGSNGPVLDASLRVNVSCVLVAHRYRFTSRRSRVLSPRLTTKCAVKVCTVSSLKSFYKWRWRRYRKKQDGPEVSEYIMCVGDFGAVDLSSTRHGVVNVF